MKSALDIYRETFLQDAIEVLGLRMVPFTIGHAVMLDRMGIDKIRDPESLMTAVLVCSMSVKQFERRIRTHWFTVWVVWWSWRSERRWSKDPESYVRSHKLFAEYLDEQTACPDFDLIRSSDGIEGGVPFVQYLRGVLIAKLGYDPSKVMETPFTQAYWDYCSFMEYERAIEVLDGRRGENADARFADADAKHDERIRKATESMAAKDVNNHH